MDGIIYKIEIGQELYIGSTTNLTERQKKHNCNIKTYPNKLYQICRENNINNITLIELKKVKVENKKELLMIEQKYINELQPTLNTYNSIQTAEERKEYKRLNGIEYREKNKEKILLKKKEYRENNKEKEKNRHKEWRENNKEHLKKYHKEWRENNK